VRIVQDLRGDGPDQQSAEWSCATRRHRDHVDAVVMREVDDPERGISGLCDAIDEHALELVKKHSIEFGLQIPTPLGDLGSFTQMQSSLGGNVGECRRNDTDNRDSGVAALRERSHVRDDLLTAFGPVVGEQNVLNGRHRPSPLLDRREILDDVG
jgi:hypothetical protein